MHKRLFSPALPILLALLAVSGCGPDPLTSATAAKLRGISGMYLSYAVAKNGGGPASEEVFKKYLKTVEGIQLQANGIDPKALDQLFVSDRDQQPFVIQYGLSLTRISGDSKRPLAYEQKGQNGKVLVAYDSTKVDHVSEAQLKELLAAKEDSQPK